MLGLPCAVALGVQMRASVAAVHRNMRRWQRRFARLPRALAPLRMRLWRQPPAMLARFAPIAAAVVALDGVGRIVGINRDVLHDFVPR